MKINNEFSFEEVVYLKTDVNQYPRMIISMEIFKDGEIMYKLAQGTYSSYHYPFEMSREKDIVLTTNN